MTWGLEEKDPTEGAIRSSVLPIDLIPNTQAGAVGVELGAFWDS